MVVDDEIEPYSLFKAFLIKEGYNAVYFSDPILALEHFKQTSNNHSLVIADMRMPGMCGIELAKKIREVNQNVKIFLMTAFEIRDLKDNPDFRDANIDRLFQKPIVFSELRKMIDILI